MDLEERITFRRSIGEKQIIKIDKNPIVEKYVRKVSSIPVSTSPEEMSRPDTRPDTRARPCMEGARGKPGLIRRDIDSTLSLFHSLSLPYLCIFRK